MCSSRTVFQGEGQHERNSPVSPKFWHIGDIVESEVQFCFGFFLKIETEIPIYEYIYVEDVCWNLPGKFYPYFTMGRVDIDTLTWITACVETA